MRVDPRGQSFFKFPHDAPETQRLSARRGYPAGDPGLQPNKECALAHSPRFDNTHLANKDAYIASLKAGFN